MASISVQSLEDDVVYPDSDGKPMAETPVHRLNLTDLIDMLESHFTGVPDVYISGNMFLYYERDNPRRNVAPDVFVVRGIPKDTPRRTYKTWLEGKGPDLVVELTSPSTRDEDFEDKFQLYRDVLRVQEYFLFDPLSEYLDPPLQGFRLVEGEYLAIEPVEGRLPSEVVGLHFEPDGQWARLYDPTTGHWVPNRRELAEIANHQLKMERNRRKAETRRANAKARRVAELERELEELRRRLADGAGE